MVRTNQPVDSQHQFREVTRFLQAWRVTVASDGRISIRPTVSSLRLVEFVRLLQRLRDCCDGTFPHEILFDLNHVHVVGAPQSIIDRLMGHFARSVNARFKVVGHGCG